MNGSKGELSVYLSVLLVEDSVGACEHVMQFTTRAVNQRQTQTCTTSVTPAMCCKSARHWLTAPPPSNSKQMGVAHASCCVSDA